MKLLEKMYERRHGRPAPRHIRENSLFSAVWRQIRKFLNVSIIPFIPFNPLRIWLYRLIGFKIGKGVFIGMQCYLDDYAPRRMVIEDKVTVSYRVTFACHGPRTDEPRLILREGCYIGCCAVLLGGVEIGPYATVGASAMVNRDVEPMTTVVGVPAKVIRRNRPPWRSEDYKTEELMQRFGLAAKPDARENNIGG